MRQTSSAYRRMVRWLPPAARIPRRRSASEYERETAIACRASASVYRGPDVLTIRTLVRSTDGNAFIGERGFEPRPPGPKPGVQRQLHHSPARAESVSGALHYQLLSSPSGSSSDVRTSSLSP